MALAVVLSATSATGATSKKDAPAKLGQIAVITRVADGADEFTADYIAELILAGAGGSSVYRAVYPEVLRAILAELESDAASCSTDDACLRALSSLSGVHHVVIAELSKTAAETTLRLEIATPLAGEVRRTPVEVEQVGEEPLIRAAPALGESIAKIEPVAIIRIEAPEGLSVVIDSKAAGTTPATTLHLAAGTHTVELHRDGHAPWKSRVALEAGKRYLLRARIEE